jgi:exonuclease VII small subunit
MRTELIKAIKQQKADIDTYKSNYELLKEILEALKTEIIPLDKPVE